MNEKIYQLKITLRDSKPPIWRRVLVKDSTKLSRLHRIIQIVFGWTNSHLHQFVIGDKYYSTPDPYAFIPILDERRFRLKQVTPKEKTKFVYEYDFGDYWVHQILVEKILPYDPKIWYPICIKGRLACPPEDIGGIWGYYNFLEALRDPNHAEHEDFVEWYGGEFDSERFDLEEINRLLRPKNFSK